MHRSVAHITYDDLFFFIVTMTDSAFFALKTIPEASHLDYLHIELWLHAAIVIDLGTLITLEDLRLL